MRHEDKQSKWRPARVCFIWRLGWQIYHPTANLRWLYFVKLFLRSVQQILDFAQKGHVICYHWWHVGGGVHLCGWHLTERDWRQGGTSLWGCGGVRLWSLLGSFIGERWHTPKLLSVHKELCMLEVISDCHQDIVGLFSCLCDRLMPFFVKFSPATMAKLETEIEQRSIRLEQNCTSHKRTKTRS